MRTVCAVVFGIFTFCYLYFFQADLLSVEQHVLSEGKTTYSPLIGAVLITFVLYLVQLGVFAVTKLYKRAHALTYFPSVLLLLLLTVAHPNPVEGSLSVGVWPWVAIVLLALFCWVAWLSYQFQPYEPKIGSSGLFSRMTWVNLLTLGGMFFFLGLACNHHDVEHYKMRLECRMQHGDFDDAWKAKAGTATDSSLVMLRAYCLSRLGLLGEHLFELPLVGGSQALRPDGLTTTTMLYPELEIRRYASTKAADEYRLCSFLMDKDLAGFVKSVKACYDLNNDKDLPKHYKEALVLYQHKVSNPSVEYKNKVFEADYADFVKTGDDAPDELEKKNKIRDVYGNTYWYYYKYVAK